MFETYNQSNSTSLITLIPCHVYFEPPCILRLPRARVARMTPVNLSIPPGPFNSFQQVTTASTLIQPTHGNITWNKNDKKNGLERKCWDILCRDILPLMQKQNVLWLFVHTGQFRSSTATNFLAMTSHTWESTSLPLIFSSLMEISYLGAWW